MSSMSKMHDRVRSGPGFLRGLRTPEATSSSALSDVTISLRLIADFTAWVFSATIGAGVLGASLAHGLIAGGVAASIQLVLGGFAGLYRGRWRVASFDEAIALSLSLIHI